MQERTAYQPFQERIAYQGITFDDVLLEPGYSEILPAEADVRTHLTRNIPLNIPIVSSPMDTVTESELAIALAQEGGIGIIHKNLSIDHQTREVDKVKRSENGIITDPVTLPPDATVGMAKRMMEQHKISGVPITVGTRLVGILTRRDLRFLTAMDQRLDEVMTRENLVTAAEDTTLEEAERILTRNKVEKLLLVDEKYNLRGLITIKDIDKMENYPHACKDKRGRLRVGAAIGVRDYERAESLLKAEVDFLVVDSAHGHSLNVIETVKEVKRRFAVDVVAGNIASVEGAKALAKAGADAIKVGIGPGCFAAGTRVLMANATYKNIEEIKDGDRVINMYGEPVTVKKAWCTGVREVMAVRHTASYRETVVTPDHRYYSGDLNTVAKATASKKSTVAVLENQTESKVCKLGWTEIGKLGQDAMLLPKRVAFELPEHFGIAPGGSTVRKNKLLTRYPTEIQDSYELGYVFGTFLCDGHACFHMHKRTLIGQVSWFLRPKKQETVEKLVRCLQALSGIVIHPQSSDQTIDIHLCSFEWAVLLSRLGKQEERHLPPEYMCGNPQYLQGLLDGLMDSNGQVDDRGRLDFSHPSPKLVELFGVLCLLMEGSFPEAATEEPTSEIQVRPEYRARLNVSHRKRHLKEFQVVKKLEDRRLNVAVPVYDIEVDCPTHSFIADNAIVHNSICTTRVVSGVGVPQITAIHNAVEGLKGMGIPIIADGGIRYSGDITKALAAGANVVMIGGLFAGLAESPGEMILYKGRSFKAYRGMGSMGAMMAGSGDRYGQPTSAAPAKTTGTRKLVPEGVEGRVPYKGPLAPFVYQLVGGLRAGMGYCGTRNIEELRTRARFIQVSAASVQESHPHDIAITQESPNYSVSRTYGDDTSA
jgi:inosine-5'-monophosphate dehydrogenase